MGYLSLLFFVIGALLIYINPDSSLNRFLFFLLASFSLSVLSYARTKKIKNNTTVRDTVYRILFAVVIILGILTLLMIYVFENKTLIDIFFISFASSLIALLIRGQFLKKRKTHK